MIVQSDEFAGKRIAISGACGGLGRVFARVFAEHGAELILLDQDDRQLAALAGELGPAHQAVAYDQGRPDSIARALAATDRIDILINNAGYMLRKSLLETSAAEVADLIGVNLTGAIIMAMTAAEKMKGRGGTIVNIASQLAFASEPDRAIYSVSKAGLVQFTRNASREWTSLGIRTFAVAPGVVRTNMTEGLSPAAREKLMSRVPDGRMLEPEEVVRMVAFLASRDGQAFVGQTLIADGGYLIH